MLKTLHVGFVLAALMASSGVHAQNIHRFGPGDLVIEHGDTVTMISLKAHGASGALRPDTTKVLFRGDSALRMYPLPRQGLAPAVAARIHQLVRLARQSDSLHSLLPGPGRPPIP